MAQVDRKEASGICEANDTMLDLVPPTVPKSDVNCVLNSHFDHSYVNQYELLPKLSSNIIDCIFGNVVKATLK